MFAVVVGVAFLLLLVAFRSVVIPLVSIALNLLSVGAAYGLITLIFQDGRLQGLLGYTSFGGIIPWVPLFMFVFLFGISMDYHVFILSRIRELRAAGRRPRERHRRRHRQQRRGGHQRGDHHGGGVLHLLASWRSSTLKMLGVGLAAAMLHGRHHRPRRPAPRRHGPARRPVLVPARAGCPGCPAVGSTLGHPSPPRRANTSPSASVRDQLTPPVRWRVPRGCAGDPSPDHPSLMASNRIEILRKVKRCLLPGLKVRVAAQF